jgi:hypothetical protein
MKNIVGWRLYIVSLLGAILLLISVRFFVIPRFDTQKRADVLTILGQVSDSLLGATIASLIVSILVFWIIPKNRPTVEETVLVPPKRISSELRHAANEATKWSYRGHTGRYFRTTVLPILQNTSTKHGRYIDVQIQILDPDDADLMRFFARYRAEVNRDRSDYWTTSRARAEIVATAVALILADAGSSRLNCELYFTKNVSPFTIDLSNTHAITTRESPTHAALKYPAGSTMYDSASEDLHLSAVQARRVEFERPESTLIATGDELNLLLNRLGLAMLHRDEIVETVLTVLKNPVSPYANA